METTFCPFCNQVAHSIEDFEGTYFCPTCGVEIDEEDIEKKSSGGILGAIITIIIIIVLYNWLFATRWTLFVCDKLQNENNRYECNTNAFVFENKYKSLEDCINNGNRYLTSYPGFECGYKCKIDSSFGGWVCKRINE